MSSKRSTDFFDEFAFHAHAPKKPCVQNGNTHFPEWFQNLDDDAILALWKESDHIRLCALTQYGMLIGRTAVDSVPDDVVRNLSDRGVDLVVASQNFECSCPHTDPLKALSVRPNMPFSTSVGMDDACLEFKVAVECKAEALAQIFVEGRLRLWW
tara:strand:+ start:1603 stop:2067 length:465 start_codon:yes stop_codon:yes gene_type:complete